MGSKGAFFMCTSLYFIREAQAWLSNAAGVDTTDARHGLPVRREDFVQNGTGMSYTK